jgi:hypothetical protein
VISRKIILQPKVTIENVVIDLYQNDAKNKMNPNNIKETPNPNNG